MQTRLERERFVTRVRRSFTHSQRLERVGYVGCELHRTGCRTYQEARVWPELGMDAIEVGTLELALLALLDDYPEGNVGFPALHECLRT